MLKYKVALCLALAGFALPASASAATIGECVAAQVTADMKKTIVSDYLADGPSLVGKSLPRAAAFAAVCLPSGHSPTEADVRRVSTVMAGYWMKSGAEAAVVQRHRVSLAQLDAAWRGLPPALRDRFSRGGSADEQSNEAMIVLITTVRPDVTRTALNQLSEDNKDLVALVRDITAYGIGRGMFEQPDLFEPPS